MEIKKLLKRMFSVMLIAFLLSGYGKIEAKPRSGDWSFSTDFGEFKITVNNNGTYITKIVLSYSDFTCGRVTQNGSVTLQRSPGWAISYDQFTIDERINPDGTIKMTIKGTFSKAGDRAGGTWSNNSLGIVCTGSWGLMLSVPDEKKLTACLNQDEVDAAFSTWLKEASVVGVSDAQLFVAPENPDAPDACGGFIEVTWTAESETEENITETRKFTVSAAPKVTLTVPESMTNEKNKVNGLSRSGDWRVPTEFGEFVLTVNPDGTVITKLICTFSDYTCGGVTQNGSITIQSLSGWPITDNQFTVQVSLGTRIMTIKGTFNDAGNSASGTWSLNVSGIICSGNWELTQSVPGDNELDACLTQDEVDAAFSSWIGKASVKGGCNSQLFITPENPEAPDACGGFIEVSWTVRSECEEDITETRKFTVSDAPKVTLIVPENMELDECLPQDEMDAAFSSWMEQAGVEGGCNAQLVIYPEYPNAPTSCGSSIEVTWTVKSACEEDIALSRTFAVPKSTVSVEDIDDENPERFIISQIYPNPYNSTTTIQFILSRMIHVSIRVYNILGFEVTTLVDQYFPPGQHETTWNTDDVNSGLYIYRIQAGDFVETKKSILLK